MTFPATAWATGDLVSGSQLNALPVRIANTTLAGSAGSISFTSIPGHYAHLLVEAYLRSDFAAVNPGVGLRFNSDLAANYDYQQLEASAASPVGGEVFAATSIDAGGVPGSTAGANLFSALRMLIPHYAQASNNKAVLCCSAHKSGTSSGAMEVRRAAGFWRSSAAIEDITLVPTGNFVAGCRATLIGLP